MHMDIQRAREATENQMLWMKRRHTIAKCLIKCSEGNPRLATYIKKEGK